MRKLALVLLVLTTPAVAGSADRAFSLRLGSFTWPPPDPRTEQRRAVWDSPTGRLEHEMAQQRAGLGSSGLVGAGGAGLAVRVRVQRGFSPRLVASFSDRGVELYEQSLPTVRWPWQDESPEEVPSLDEQLGALLERRLNANS